MNVKVEVFPSFNYARDGHTARATLSNDTTNKKLQTVFFDSSQERLQLDIFVNSKIEGQGQPKTDFRMVDGHLGQGLEADLCIVGGQNIVFVLHSPEKTLPGENQIDSYLGRLEMETFEYWSEWSRRCTFRGTESRLKEVCSYSNC
jgi:hypothetical protein